MDYLELSSKDVEEKSIELYQKIIKDYDYDLVIFIAKGSYTIGKKLADLNNCDLLEVKATRTGNKLKKMLSPFLKVIPKNVKMFLRKKEFNSNIHENNTERNIIYNKDIWDAHKNCERILLVDDSVDTGYSIKSCKEEIQKFFPSADVKVAAFNYFEKSTKVVNTDYSIYIDTMLNGPWSSDSKYYSTFLEEYNSMKRG